MAQVRGVVGRDAADVHPRRPVRAGGHHLAAGGVVHLERGTGARQGRQERSGPGEHDPSLDCSSDVTGPPVRSGRRRRRTGHGDPRATCRRCGGRTRGSPRRPPPPSWPPGGRRGCRAARTGRWPTWSGTSPRCSASGPGWCGPARRTPSAYVAAGPAPRRRAARLRGGPERGAGGGPGRRRPGRAGVDLGASAGRGLGAAPAGPGGGGAHRRRGAGARRRPPDPGRRRPRRPRRVAGGHGARARCPTARRPMRTRWSSTPSTPTPSGRSSPARARSRSATLTGTAGDLLLAVWRRVPLDVLTVDGDGALAAAMIASVDAGVRSVLDESGQPVQRHPPAAARCPRGPPVGHALVDGGRAPCRRRRRAARGSGSSRRRRRGRRSRTRPPRRPARPGRGG